MIILGIDPGLKETGWGVLSCSTPQNILTHRGHGVISTPSHLSLSQRLLLIAKEIETLIQQYEPTALANEALLFQKNISSALPVAHARGVVLLLAERFGLQIKSYAPKTIKLAVTGNGGASKNDVQQMVKILLKLPSIPQPDHAADALAMAITYAYGTPPVSDKLT